MLLLRVEKELDHVDGVALFAAAQAESRRLLETLAVPLEPRSAGDVVPLRRPSSA